MKVFEIRYISKSGWDEGTKYTQDIKANNPKEAWEQWKRMVSPGWGLYYIIEISGKDGTTYPHLYGKSHDVEEKMKNSFYSKDSKAKDSKVKDELTGNWRREFIEKFTKELQKSPYSYSLKEANDIAMKRADNERNGRFNSVDAMVRHNLSNTLTKAQYEKEYNDSKVKDETIKTPRGTFVLTEKTEQELKNEGYGYHHSSEDGRYKIYVKNNQAVAVRTSDSKVKDYTYYKIPKGTTLSFKNAGSFGASIPLVNGEKQYTFDKDMTFVSIKEIREYVEQFLSKKYNADERSIWILSDWSQLEKFKAKDSKVKDTYVWGKKNGTWTVIGGCFWDGHEKVLEKFKNGEIYQGYEDIRINRDNKKPKDSLKLFKVNNKVVKAKDEFDAINKYRKVRDDAENDLYSYLNAHPTAKFKILENGNKVFYGTLKNYDDDEWNVMQGITTKVDSKTYKGTWGSKQYTFVLDSKVKDTKYTIKSISKDGEYYLANGWGKRIAMWVKKEQIRPELLFNSIGQAKASLTKLLQMFPEYKSDTFEEVSFNDSLKDEDLKKVVINLDKLKTNANGDVQFPKNQFKSPSIEKVIEKKASQNYPGKYVALCKINNNNFDYMVASNYDNNKQIPSEKTWHKTEAEARKQYNNIK